MQQLARHPARGVATTTPHARRASLAHRARHRRRAARFPQRPQATSAFGVKVLEGPDDDPTPPQEDEHNSQQEYAGIEIVRPDAQGNVPEDDVGFAGIEIVRESTPSEPELDVAFAGIEILRAPPDAPVVEQPENEILGIEVVREASVPELPAEFAGVEIVREDGTPVWVMQ